MVLSKAISKVLRHPLTLLFVTAIVSGWLVPRITRSWQDHQREGELKVQLVTEAGTAVAKMLTAAQFSEFGGSGKNQEEIDEDFKAWNTQQVVISTKIRAYVTDAAVAKDWDTFSEMITNVYALSAQGAPRRKKYLGELRRYIGDADVDWPALEAGYKPEEPGTDFLQYNRAWYQLKTSLLDRFGKLSQQILAADIRS
jgi:hypothetical protein